MNTARIVVLAIAPSAGGAAARRASGMANEPLPAALAAQLPTLHTPAARVAIVPAGQR